ncbi:ATP-dependent DNA helicase PcrA [Fundidesulfovibrio magnetotacticus]|uniref:DNA 3'-5' helicase n=1 Tax=Fundidesulfovibrio magnetotacticus TaxID=2730080 RepID=A0A6V8LUF8_9BACT|nr:ATP-dependent helicase [Fundidesulfovibrio magnetotacticus]GFK93446.1 ATP-dependent DNA helicase PcrA [Fundidesulfovibrio magnetotacticus]
MPIDFAARLNPAQLEAVTATEGPVLVIAGAGSGKTRTLVYRLARLVSQGVEPSSILLLTFTRKAAAEMLARAERLLGMALGGVQGGTFHAFSFATLRRNPEASGHAGSLTIMDRGDAEEALSHVIAELGAGKGDKSFPKKGFVLELISKSRNKELPIPEILSRESYQLLPHAAALEEIARGFERYKRGHGLLDYDDMLFTLEQALTRDAALLERLRERHRYLMVDEYQDTNLVQARLVKLLAGERGNVMAVGDDAQSIYAFRGANVENILSFPRIYPGTRVVRLEQNYRSTQPILDLTNAVLRQAKDRFDKNLFSERLAGPKPEVVKAYSDQTQAQLAVRRIRELRREHLPCEIAVLFRAGYQSYALELALNKEGVPFQKYGGLRFSEAAHVKDAVAFLRVVHNPRDVVAWKRVLVLVDKVGEKTALKIAASAREGDFQALDAQRRKNPGLDALFSFLEELRADPGGPASLLERAVVFYTPTLTRLHPEDYPRRLAGLEQLSQIAASYAHLEAFLADLALENPEEERKGVREDAVVLSTVHSAKGLEWPAVLILDLVDERFPSRHALARPEDLEEERRLLYVACTRAKDSLTLYVPGTVYNRAGGGSQPAMPSLFVRELPRECFTELRETFSGGLTPALQAQAAAEPRPSWDAPSSGGSRFASRGVAARQPLAADPDDPRAEPGGSPFASASDACGTGAMSYCSHRIFGRGKVVAVLDGGKCRVNFPGFGLKVILREYLEMEP